MRTSSHQLDPATIQARRDQRDQLVREHLGLVHHVARLLYRRLSTEASLDDLVSAGSLGLLDAAESFDAARGLAFSTFALPRIRGAMLDDLRNQDLVPRSARRKARALNTAREQVAQRDGRNGSDREVAAQLGVEVETIWRWNTDLAAANQVSIDGATSNDDDSTGRTWQFAVEDEPIDFTVLREETSIQLRSALESLPPRDRQVLALYYYEELTQSQIAQVLSVTESRISQIRSQALKRLRAVLAPLRAELVA